VCAVRVSVVIPAFNAEAQLPRTLGALRAQDRPPDEVIVVDDGSTDRTSAVAGEHGAHVIRTDGDGYVGGARNRGWDSATGDVVVFLDADMVVAPGWGAGLERALTEFPGALIGCARTFEGRTPWGWVAHLQTSTPYLPRGGPREVTFLPSGSLAVPREIDLRWDESYGGEDGIFCAQAVRAGHRLVFDPRISAEHDSERTSFAELRRMQQRLVYGFARCAPIHREGFLKRIRARIPLHYFALIRLVFIYRRIQDDPELRRQFTRNLPRLIVAEWALGVAATRYVFRPPPLYGHERVTFRTSPS
jgi:glycosyltransferase involved in cell wall biosynthesis